MKTILKKISAIVLSASLVILAVADAAYAKKYTDNAFPVELNGESVALEGYNIDGSTYFKLRDISSAVGGFDVDFAHNMILLSKDGYTYDTNAMEDYTIASEVVKPDCVFDINGEIYTTKWALTNGGLQFASGNFPIKTFYPPVSDTLSFCYYKGRIYYMAWEGGSEDGPESIYSCNIDGSDAKLLTDNVGFYSEFYIADDYLYYDACHFEDENGDGYLYGETPIHDGIYKINIDTGEKTSVIDASGIDITSGAFSFVGMDKSALYYWIYNMPGVKHYAYYAVNLNGEDKREVDDPSEYGFINFSSDGIIKDDIRYYIEDDTIYFAPVDGSAEPKAVCNVEHKTIPGRTVSNEHSYIASVRDNYLYYTVQTMFTDLSAASPNYTFLYRVEIEPQPSGAEKNLYPVKLNGENVNLDGYNIDGSTYFKLRDIADAVGGFGVDFFENTIQIVKDGYSYNTAVSANPEQDKILIDYAKENLRSVTVKAEYDINKDAKTITTDNVKFFKADFTGDGNNDLMLIAYDTDEDGSSPFALRLYYVENGEVKYSQGFLFSSDEADDYDLFATCGRFSSNIAKYNDNYYILYYSPGSLYGDRRMLLQYKNDEWTECCSSEIMFDPAETKYTISTNGSEQIVSEDEYSAFVNAVESGVVSIGSNWGEQPSPMLMTLDELK